MGVLCFSANMNTQRIWSSLHPFFEEGSRLGRTEANRSFITALLEADPFDGYHFFLPHPDNVRYLEGELRKNFPQLHARGRFNVRLHRELPGAVAEREYYCMHLSDPCVRYSDAMCIRNAFSRRIFPLTAPTHSLSYAEYGRDFLKHAWPGATGRDVIVATSRAGVRVVRNYYQTAADAYGQSNAPQVRHIPLGVEPAKLPSTEDQERLGRAARQRFALGDEVIFLIFARISYQSKMDLLPVLRAFKRAEAEGLAPGSCRLVLAGWMDDDDSFGEDIKKIAGNMGIPCSLVPCPDNEARKGLYAAAEVFLSPSDNLQETFGLTMLEASVSGLPIIASDFDGYKDLVEDGVTGLLIPSYGPDDTPYSDILSVIVPASEYHLLLAQQCAVDVAEMGRAMQRLAVDKTLRESMGRAGRERALKGYTWAGVVEQHLKLWEELNAAPCEMDGEPGQRPRHKVQHPMHPPYMYIFGDYFSRQISALAKAGRELRWTVAGEAVYRGKDFPVIYNLVENQIDLELLKRMLFMARKPVGIGVLRQELCKIPAGVLKDCDFLLLWALKQDLLELVK